MKINIVQNHLMIYYVIPNLNGVLKQHLLAASSTALKICIPDYKYMSRKGPKDGQGMLDFVENCCLGVNLH